MIVSEPNVTNLACPSCDQIINTNWKYCRFCGVKLDIQVKQEPVVEEPAIEEPEDIDEPEPEPEFNADLYYKVLSSRGKRRTLNQQRKELLDEVNSLLEQVKSGLTSRDYALPKIKSLKSQVESLNAEAEKFSNVPETLPLETLLDEIESAENRLEKLKDMKADDNISKNTLKEAQKRYEENITLLRDQQSKVNGNLRTWNNGLKAKLKEKRKDLEMLYIKKETGELTESAYAERKDGLVKEINDLDNITKTVDLMLKV